MVAELQIYLFSALIMLSFCCSISAIRVEYDVQHSTFYRLIYRLTHEVYTIYFMPFSQATQQLRLCLFVQQCVNQFTVIIDTLSYKAH